MKTIGKSLKLIRQHYKVSQKCLAESIKLSSSYISEIESGNKSPSVTIIEMYSTYFKLPVSKILEFHEFKLYGAKTPEEMRKYRKQITTLLSETK